MKLIYLFSILLFFPFTSYAATYWLVNPDNLELGDFVELSALEYAETNISKDLLIYLGEDFNDLLDQAEDSVDCHEKYEDIIASLKQVVTINDLSPHLENNLEVCLLKEEEKIAEKEAEEKLEDALEDCDMDFLDEELSNSQKVTYNKQIASCREEIQEKSEVKIETVPIQIQTQPSVQQQVIPGITQTAQPSMQTSPVSVLEEENISTEGQETEGMYDKESDIESQQKNEIATVPKQDEASTASPSFFNRIISFFTNLFSW
jgi:hypothetical protein